MAKNIATSIPLIGGLFDNTDELAMRELEKNRDLYNQIQLPDHVWRDLAPEAFSSESANYNLVNEDPGLRSKQMDLLGKMSGLADTGLSEVDQAGFAKARTMGDQMARQGREAALQDAQARGVAGSGMEFAMKEMANQGGAQRAQEAGLNQAGESARQRAMYQQAYGNALSGARGQDMQAAQSNADIINRFNMANTQQRNQTSQMNTQTRNDSQKYNNEGRTNTAQQNFQNQMTRANGIAGANGKMADGYAAQNAANTSDRNMWTQIGAQAGLAAFGVPAKKPAGGI